MSSARKRRQLPTFNLSFLDIMFCGFGAVVLLVLIVNSQTVRTRKDRGRDLEGRVTSLDLEVKAGEKTVKDLRNSMEIVDSEIAAAEKASALLIRNIKKTRAEIAQYENSSLARKQSVNRLQSDLKTMDAARKRLLAEKKMDQDAGEKSRHFSGEGNRQYLTGLRLGGRRVILLVDASASMLDRTILGIIRRRNLPGESRLKSAKWQRTIRTARWLLANLPPDSSVRIAAFNTNSTFLGDSGKSWIPVTSRARVDRMVSELRKIVPAGGTSLAGAFSAAARLTPRPDNIILLTDGLPTMGTGSPGRSRVSSEQRVRLFRQALKRLPGSVPVNTILFPLEGDPMAAGLFWKLAVDTKGSFLTPSRDWP